MTAPVEEFVITPGVHQIPHDVYKATPALSFSGAKKLLPPYAPAIYRWEQENPVHTDAFDLGLAAHAVVLADGAPIVVVEADGWRTNAAKQARQEAYEAGAIPLLAADHDLVQAMAAAVRAHPLASKLLDPTSGKAEQSLFWQDKETGVWCRCRADWLRHKVEGRRLIVVDFKTAASAHPDKFSKSAMDYGYAMQASWYMDGVRAVGLDDDPAFVFVIVEKRPPHLVSVVELDEPSLSVGMNLSRIARLIYRDCLQSGQWPGYSPGVELVSLPAWYLRAHDEEPL
jgi:hypothetical protein